MERSRHFYFLSLVIAVTALTTSAIVLPQVIPASVSTGQAPDDVRQVPLQGGDFGYDFSAHARVERDTHDVIIFPGPVSATLSSHGELLRNASLFALSADPFESITLGKCVQALKREPQKGLSVPEGLSACIQTPAGEVVKVTVISSPAALKYVLFPERPAREGPGVVTFKLGEHVFFDFTAREFSSSSDSSTYDIQFIAREGEGVIYMTVDPARAKIAYVTQGGYDVTLASTCTEFLKNANLQTLTFLSSPNHATCLRTRDGYLVKMDTPKITNGTITVPYYFWATEGKSFTADTISWEMKETAVDFTKRTHVDPSTAYQVRFTAGTSPSNGWSFIALDGGQNRATFAAPWTRYAETTASVCARTFEYDASYAKFSLMQKTEVVCFLTADGILGKIGRPKFGQTPSVQYEVWKDAAPRSRRTPTFSREWRGSITVPMNNQWLPFSLSTFSALSSTAQPHHLSFVYNPSPAWDETIRLRVGEGWEIGGETRFALAQPTAGLIVFGQCTLALQNPTVPYVPVYLDNKWYPVTRVPVCFETADGYMGELVRQENKVLFTIWRKASVLTKDGRTFEEKDEPDACPSLTCEKDQICRKFCRYPTCAELNAADCGWDQSCNGQAKPGLRDPKDGNSLTVCCIGTCGAVSSSSSSASASSSLAAAAPPPQSSSQVSTVSSVSSSSASPSSSSSSPSIPSSSSVPSTPSSSSSTAISSSQLASSSTTSSSTPQLTAVSGTFAYAVPTAFDVEKQSAVRQATAGVDDLFWNTVTTPQSRRECTRRFFRTSCKTVTWNIYTLTLTPLNGTKLVTIPKAYTAVSLDDCKQTLAKYPTGATLISPVTNATVGCFQTSNGMIGKIGHTSLPAISYTLWK